MRNIPINDVDHLPQAVLALGSDYPADTLLDTHSHRRAQVTSCWILTHFCYLSM